MITISSRHGQISFGQHNILRQIFGRVYGNLTQGPQSCAIVAPPFFGKTAILHSIVDKDIQASFYVGDERLLMAFIDCRDVTLSREDAFKSFGKGLAQVSDVFSPACLELIDKFLIASQLDELMDLLNQIMVVLNKENYSIVFVLDHFELFLSLFLESDIQFFRELLDKTKHAFIVAIPKPLSELTPKTYPSKFYLLFLSIFIKNFSDKQAKEYVNNRIGEVNSLFSSQDVDTVLMKCGRHPFFLNIYIFIF